jgi:hypothetical protein
VLGRPCTEVRDSPADAATPNLRLYAKTRREYHATALSSKPFLALSSENLLVSKMAVTANGSNSSTGETEDPRKIRLDRLAYVHYQHPDLSKAHRFLTDFGMEKVKETENRIYYRGFGAAPCIYVAEASPTPDRNFVGGAWVVESYRDLEDAAALPGASQIADSDVPGGGSTVTLKDPNGHNIMLVFGQTLSSHSKSLHQVEMNSACVKPRVGVFQRFKPGPSPVHKLGHYGFVVRKSTFFSTREWYTRTFNLKVTDSVFDPESNVDETSFLHIDKGKEYTDHHVSANFLCFLAAHLYHISLVYCTEMTDHQFSGLEFVSGRRT